MTAFKTMTALLNNQTPTTEDKKSVNSFFLCRWLSNDVNTLQMANIININYNIPVLNQYKFCEDWIDLVQLKKLVKFIKFSKDKPNKEFQNLLGNIQRKYNINEQTALSYYDMMNNDQRNIIKNMYNEGLTRV